MAELGSKFDADVAVGVLADAGIAATASYDPALNTSAGFLASDRTVEVLVAEEDEDRAREVLQRAALFLPAAFTDDMDDWPGPPRPRRLARSVVIVGVAVVVALGLVLPLVAVVIRVLGGS